MILKELDKQLSPITTDIIAKYKDLEQIIKCNAHELDNTTLIESLTKIEDFKRQISQFKTIFKPLF